MSFSKIGMQVIPVGGCNEIGMNMTLYHHNNCWLMVDCGIGFAGEGEAPGIDIKVLDLKFLEEKNIKLSGIVITHVHEDHVGGVCYLLNYLKCPIYSTVFVANFLRNRALSLKIARDLNIIEILPTNPIFQVGSFSVEMVGLTHSIVESRGLYIKADGVKTFHTGDWKFDPNPVVGELSQKDRLKEIGDEGLDLLVCDSTNVFKPGPSETEGSMEDSLLNLLKGEKNRIVIGLFSSNIARLTTIAKIAKVLNRKLVAAGTSLHKIIGIAVKSGYLTDLDYVDLKQARDIPRDEILLVATGCQGEPMATISKLASCQHPLLKLSTGDMVVLSSKIIPVNHNRILKMVDTFITKGINVITEKDAFVHVSGHPNALELKEMYSLLRPTNALPVHGNPLLLREHCRLATESFGAAKSHFTSDGSVFSVNKSGEMTEIDKMKVYELGVDGYILRPLDSIVMKERKKIEQAGSISCFVSIDSSGRLFHDPSILSAGLLDEEEDLDLIDEIIGLVIKLIQRCSYDFSSDASQSNKQKLSSDISRRILQHVRHFTNKSPLVKTSITIV